MFLDRKITFQSPYHGYGCNLRKSCQQLRQATSEERNEAANRRWPPSGPSSRRSQVLEVISCHLQSLCRGVFLTELCSPEPKSGCWLFRRMAMKKIRSKRHTDGLRHMRTVIEY